MKKILLLALVLILPVIMLSGCNQKVFDFDLTFKKALVYENGVWNEYEVSKWNDYENDMICIWTTDGKMIYTSGNNIVLYG